MSPPGLGRGPRNVVIDRDLGHTRVEDLVGTFTTSTRTFAVSMSVYTEDGELAFEVGVGGVAANRVVARGVGGTVVVGF